MTRLDHNEPEHVLEIFLQPGEFYWGDGQTRIRTLLGSCVSICMWHPGDQIGGMCHFMLPEKPGSTEMTRDPRYADAAMLLFLGEITKSRTNLADYQVKIFGGANMLQESGKLDPVGDKNVAAARRLVKQYNLNLVAEHLGGSSARRLHFNLWDGSVWLRK
ncbi:MAG: chemotaxis protein CheD [Leptospiraceae bacterium]|nr:chemotaxis protein CheD [Leptospiraceae bacterium]